MVYIAPVHKKRLVYIISLNQIKVHSDDQDQGGKLMAFFIPCLIPLHCNQISV